MGSSDFRAPGEHSELNLRKSAEKNLEASEEVFRLLVDAVDEYAIFALDTSGHILTWNLGAQRLKGYSASEIIGSHIRRFYTQPDIDRFHPEHELRIAADTGKYEEEGWRVRKDGSTFWANVVITALRDANGVLRGYGKVTRDLTQRRIAEVALRESEERFRLMIEGVQEYAIFMLDPKGFIKTWNKGAERNKGYKAEEIIGKHFSIFYGPEDAKNPKTANELRDAVAKGRYEEEGWRLRKDGTKFWANVVITPVHDAKNNLLGFSKVTRNLTERKKAEESLREAYADLENRIALRTKELSQAKLRAEEAVKARDEFFSMASHELKTPLSSLKLQTQIRKRAVSKGDYSDFAPENLAELCSDDERQINRLTGLVDRMLDISRLTSGNLELSVEKFDLSEMATETARRLQPILRESGNEITVIAPDKIVGDWDRLRLEQVLTNFLTNAGKYAPGKPVEVRVLQKNALARLEVRDHGKGIREEDQRRIFEPFERLKNGETAGGLGLGLYITERMVAAHGGKIHVESNSGDGATFIVELPMSVVGSKS